MELILIFTCDEWKSTSSMNLVGVFTNLKHVKACIKDLEKKEYIELDDGSDDRYNGDYSDYDLTNSFKYLYVEAHEPNKYEL